VGDLPEVALGIFEVGYSLAPRLCCWGLYEMDALAFEVLIFSVDVVDEDRVVGSMDGFFSWADLLFGDQFGNVIDRDQAEYDPFLVTDAKECRVFILVLQLESELRAVERRALLKVPHR